MWSFVFRIWDLGVGVQDSRLQVCGWGLERARVWSLGLRVCRL